MFSLNDGSVCPQTRVPLVFLRFSLKGVSSCACSRDTVMVTSFTVLGEIRFINNGLNESDLQFIH